MICKEKGCGLPVIARGWCWTHYQRWRRHGSPKAVRRTKRDKAFYSHIGSLGGRARKRGHFGRLKDEGKTTELSKLAKKAAAKSNAVQAKSKNKGTEPAEENSASVPRGRP